MPYKVLLSKYFPVRVKCCKIVICWAMHTREKVEITVDRNMLGGVCRLVPQSQTMGLKADDILRQRWAICTRWV